MAVRRVVPNLQADAPGESAEFYAGLLGMDPAMDLGWIVTYVAPGNRTTQVSVMQADASAPVFPEVSVEVDDVDAVHTEAKRRGYDILHPLTDEPWGVRRFFVRDPSGRIVNVLSHS
jgi:predicted enzyme related to lactoylglutathione lyase